MKKLIFIVFAILFIFGSVLTYFILQNDKQIQTSSSIKQTPNEDNINMKAIQEYTPEEPITNQSTVDNEKLPATEQKEVGVISSTTIPTDTTVQNSVNELIVRDRQLGPNITVGYIWRSFEGSPKFQSLRIPIWDLSAMEKEYRIDIWNDNSFVFYKNAKPLIDEIIFPDGGVNQFRVLGIDPAFGICPAEHSRFTWEVTFASNGVFKGERIPITIDGSKNNTTCRVVH